MLTGWFLLNVAHVLHSWSEPRQSIIIGSQIVIHNAGQSFPLDQILPNNQFESKHP